MLDPRQQKRRLDGPAPRLGAVLKIVGALIGGGCALALLATPFIGPVVAIFLPFGLAILFVGALLIYVGFVITHGGRRRQIVASAVCVLVAAVAPILRWWPSRHYVGYNLSADKNVYELSWTPTLGAGWLAAWALLAWFVLRRPGSRISQSQV